MTRRRKTPYSAMTIRAKENAAIGERIVAQLESGPMMSADLQAMFGLEENRLANILTRLLKAGKISRAAVTGRKYRYYHGLTSGEAYKPETRSKPPKVSKHAIPTHQVVVRPFTIAGEDGKAFMVTMPKPPFAIPSPWEVRV